MVLDFFSDLALEIFFQHLALLASRVVGIVDFFDLLLVIACEASQHFV
jgi:hypothetical protein